MKYIIYAVLSIFLVPLFCLFYTKDLSDEMEADIKKISTVKEIIRMSEEHDFSNIYSFYLMMEDGAKLMITDNEYDENKILHFVMVGRIGDYRVFNAYYSDNSEYIRLSVLFNLSYIPRIEGMDYNKLLEKDTVYLLENYENLKKFVDGLPEINIDEDISHEIPVDSEEEIKIRSLWNVEPEEKYKCFKIRIRKDVDY